MLASNQFEFKSCYRKRQHPIFDLSYLRLAKVRFVQRILSEHHLGLDGKRILDFGFGAGAFLRKCPASAQLFGTEVDPVNVSEVTASLRRQSPQRALDLRVSDSHFNVRSFWPDTKFDLIVLSHVLEHVSDPSALLAHLAGQLDAGGFLICLVPINERIPDPKHIEFFTDDSLCSVARAAGLKPAQIWHDDFWLYWGIGFFSAASPFKKLVTQAFSLITGVVFCGFGWKFWSRGGRIFGLITRSKPIQLGAMFSLEGSKPAKETG